MLRRDKHSDKISSYSKWTKKTSREKKDQEVPEKTYNSCLNASARNYKLMVII
jgi:hypothetical protein